MLEFPEITRRLINSQEGTCAVINSGEIAAIMTKALAIISNQGQHNSHVPPVRLIRT